MPPLWTDTARLNLAGWPLPPEAVTHPRTAGTFGRALRLWRRGGHAAHRGDPTSDAASRARCSRPRCRRCARKGRVQAGADADLVVFDEARVTDQATYADVDAPVVGHRPRDGRAGRSSCATASSCRTRCPAGRCGPHPGRPAPRESGGEGRLRIVVLRRSPGEAVDDGGESVEAGGGGHVGDDATAGVAVPRSRSTSWIARRNARGLGCSRRIRCPTPDQTTRPPTSGLSSLPPVATIGTP